MFYVHFVLEITSLKKAKAVSVLMCYINKIFQNSFFLALIVLHQNGLIEEMSSVPDSFSSCTVNLHKLELFPIFLKVKM